MANKRSSARQALKDMLEAGLDISFLEGKLRENHQLNAEINIITREYFKPKVVETKVEVHVAFHYTTPEAVKKAPKPQYYYAMGPHGTIIRRKLYCSDGYDRD